MRCSVLFLLLQNLIFVQLVKSEEKDFFAEIEVYEDQSTIEKYSPFLITGELDYRAHYAAIKQSDKYNFRRSDKGLVSSRLDLYLQAYLTLLENVDAGISGVITYDAKADEQKNNNQLHEAYLEWRPSLDWNIKVGRQMLVFGESNFFQILDVINPLDERVLGLAELDEIRLPVSGSRFSYFSSRWGIDLLLMQEFRPNRRDDALGDFDPFIRIGGSNNVTFESKPDVSTLKPDWALRLISSRPWGDLTAVFSKTHAHAPAIYDVQGMSFRAFYPENTVAGLSGNYIFGNWLIKSEIGYRTGNRFMRSDTEALLVNEGKYGLEKKSTIELMIGGRYAGVNNLAVDLEMFTKTIDDYEDVLEEDKTNVSTVLNIDYEMLNDSLVANFFWMHITGNGGELVRFRVDYTLLDELVVYAGFISYQATNVESGLEPYKENDRFFSGLTFSF